MVAADGGCDGEDPSAGLRAMSNDELNALRIQLNAAYETDFHQPERQAGELFEAWTAMVNALADEMNRRRRARMN